MDYTPDACMDEFTAARRSAPPSMGGLPRETKFLPPEVCGTPDHVRMGPPQSEPGVSTSQSRRLPVSSFPASSNSRAMSVVPLFQRMPVPA